MNELLIKEETMSSLQIAEIVGMRHADVMRSIRNMEEAWRQVNQRNFALVDYLDAKGEKRPMYKLSKTECLYIATKFNDVARAKLVLRWEELELEKRNGGFQVPRSFSEALMLAANQAKQIEEQTKQIEAKDKQIAEEAPRVLFSKAVETSKRSCLIGELAKILQQNGISIGQNRLFKWLRENGYLCNKGEKYNQPTQKAMELGLFEIKQTVINKPDGSVVVKSTTKCSGKGQVYFVNKFLGGEECI